MIGNLSKMKVALDSPVSYQLPVGSELIGLNAHIGREINFVYKNEITCISCGKKTKKSYAQGHCYPCFISLAACDMCIMKPETCHYAAGTCREPEWASQNCLQPHYVYLANSSGVKVGITRATQIPTRWIDQGAVQALPVFKVQSRLQSGLLEVAFKKHVADKTDWRKMLRGEAESVDLAAVRDELMDKTYDKITEIKQDVGESNIEYLPAEDIVEIKYPVTEYPVKVTSLNFEKQAEITATLLGIKGQYLILDQGVLNIRKFTGYKIEVIL